MREIKFRARRIDTGAWVYGNYFHTPLTDENSGAPSETGWFFLAGERRACIVANNVAYTVDEATVGQFIGITDKNGGGDLRGRYCAGVVRGASTCRRNSMA